MTKTQEIPSELRGKPAFTVSDPAVLRACVSFGGIADLAPADRAQLVAENKRELRALGVQFCTPSDML